MNAAIVTRLSGNHSFLVCIGSLLSGCGLNTFGVADVSDGATTKISIESTSSTGDTPTTSLPTQTSSTVAAAICGNGIVDEDEICDDGNDLEYDGCQANCLSSQGDEVYAGSASGHTCVGFASSNKFKCWGDNTHGELGYPFSGPDSNIGDDEAPYEHDAVALSSPVVAVALGERFTCALAGDVYCWGGSGDGKLGRGMGGDDSDLVLLPQALPVDLGVRTAVQLSGNYAHVCALLDDDNVSCWGYNKQGQLGIGSTLPVSDSQTPNQVGPITLGGGVTARQIATGWFHTCVRTNKKEMICWGRGSEGQLGYGDQDERHSPTSSIAIEEDVVDIALGSAHTCAVLDTVPRTVRCWGLNDHGQLGRGHKTALGNDPGTIPKLIGAVEIGDVSVARVVCGEHHTCILTEGAGSVYCWGRNNSGQLGYGFSLDWGDEVDETPMSRGPVDIGGVAVSIAAGSEHTCALLDTGQLRCWGMGYDGQLGYGNQNSIGEEGMEMPPADVPWY